MSLNPIKCIGLYVFICFALMSFGFVSVKAQTEEELKQAMVKGLTLFQQQRYIEALPHLELLVKAVPDEPKLRFAYGFCLVAQSKQTDNAELAKQSSVKALEQFKIAKQLGLKDEMNDALIKILSGEGDPQDSQTYSKNPEASKLVAQGENLFAQSKYDEAIAALQKALSIDPNIYQAALSLGDCYVFKKDWANAEKSYQKAITINPNIERAYRYSATPLMRQASEATDTKVRNGFLDQARDRYIEAFITEPYSQMSPRGISQWAEISGAKLGHPKIEFPKIEINESGQVTMARPADKPDYNSEWKTYIATRVNWHKEKFAKTFPNEKQYRHTLQEEAEAIRANLKSAKEQKLSHSGFEILQKLDDEGLLEAFILMAQADDGIAEDHEAFLKNNRPKLRQYVLNYVIHSEK
ncbi:MAG: tetratricopeptide repeat protein [Pyrinomonadaceae bacterium]|nr:tetratricopeptide repeat protein [Pyrinomonadaceae bacterium]